MEAGDKSPEKTNENEGGKQKCRKRKADPELWKRNIRKKIE